MSSSAEGNSVGRRLRARSAVTLKALMSAAWVSSARSSSIRYLATRTASGSANNPTASTAVTTMTVTILRRTLSPSQLGNLTGGTSCGRRQPSGQIGQMMAVQSSGVGALTGSTVVVGRFLAATLLVLTTVLF